LPPTFMSPTTVSFAVSMIEIVPDLVRNIGEWVCEERVTERAAEESEARKKSTP
jgi:hypothetical protein